MKAIAILVVVMVMVTAVGGPASSAEPDRVVIPLQVQSPATASDDEPTGGRCEGLAPVEVLCDTTFVVSSRDLVIGMRLAEGYSAYRVVGLASGSVVDMQCTYLLVVARCRAGARGPGFLPGETARLTGDVAPEGSVAVAGAGRWAVCVGTRAECLD